MNISTPINNNQISYLNNRNKPASNEVSFGSSSIGNKFRTLAMGTMLSLASFGILTSCGDDKKVDIDTQGIEYVSDTIDMNERNNYIVSAPSSHKIQQGETLYSIARKYNVSVDELKEYNHKSDNTIYANQVLKIPQALKLKNIKTITDVSKVTGLSVEYLKGLEAIENPNDIRTVFLDKNNNKTVGVGHKLSPSEVKKYEGRSISTQEKYELLANDLMIRDTHIRNMLNPDVYDKLPIPLRESVFDFVFHRGEGSFKRNTDLIDGLNNKDYVKAVANLYMNYTILTDKKGNPYERHLAGLCKRSLIRMGNASKIFKNGIPEQVLTSAKETYEEGLKLLDEEFKDNPKYAKGTYQNVLAEYKDIAYNQFNGKIGESSNAGKSSIIAKSATTVRVDGSKIDQTKEQIEAQWAATAEKYNRPTQRPELCLDKKGNVTALVKEIAPKTTKGTLSGHTIIVNQGHGGCAAHSGSKENTVFDPGASNAVVEPIRGKNGRFKRDKSGGLILTETNRFIGNNGTALEEWEVNKTFSEELTKKLIENGAKVVYISGEVHNAQNAIRQYQKQHKVDLLISLHSNSNISIKTAKKRGREYISERVAPNGFFIIPNIRGGEDKKDFALANKIYNRYNKDSWFRDKGKIKGQSLGVLSSNNFFSSPVPGVLIEMGNLKNERDVANLSSQKYRDRLVAATYNGIVDYLKN